jgi:hypothetical protein
MEHWCNPQTERRSRHQVCNDALMGFSFVDGSELLFPIELDSDAVFKDVLDVLLLCNDCAIIVVSFDNLLKVGGVTPRDLDGS